MSEETRTEPLAIRELLVTVQKDEPAESKKNASSRQFSVEDERLTRTVEAALFMRGRGMRADELGKFLKVGTRSVRNALERLVSEYAAPSPDMRASALEVVHIKQNDRYHMRVRDMYLSLVKDLTSLTDLSDGELRTLSLIATHEPVLQSYVIRVRGNKAYGQIRKLLGKGLINTKPQGRSKSITTTRNFADYFGKPVSTIKRSLESRPTEIQKASASEQESEQKDTQRLNAHDAVEEGSERAGDNRSDDAADEGDDEVYGGGAKGTE